MGGRQVWSQRERRQGTVQRQNITSCTSRVHSYLYSQTSCILFFFFLGGGGYGGVWREGGSGLREREGRALFKGKTSLAVHQEFTHIYTLKLLVFFFFWGGGVGWGEGCGGRAGLVSEREGRALFKGKTSLAVHQEFTHIYTLKLLVFFFSFFFGGGGGGGRVGLVSEREGRAIWMEHKGYRWNSAWGK